MKLSAAMKQSGIDTCEEAAAILRFFPEECEVVVKNHQDGDIIFQEGDPLVHVGIMLQGQYACFWETSGRDDYTYLSSAPPSLLGDQAVLAELSWHTGSFRAVGKCRIALLRVPDFWLWMKRDPAYYQAITAGNLRKLLRQCRRRRSTVMDQSKIRVIKYLLWYCHIEGGAGETLPRYLTVRITRDAMTEAIGQISLRTVNRILSQLREEGVVSIVRGKLYIRPEQYLLLLAALENCERGI